MNLLARQAIRDGLCFGTKTVTNSNSCYLPEGRDESKEETQLMMLDVCALYSYSMMNICFLDGQYEWITDEAELEKLKNNISGYLI